MENTENSKLFMKVDTNIKLSSVILSDENKEKVKQFINENRNKDKLIEYGLKPMNKILMYGASGTGKTLLSKALSNYMGYKMLYVDIADSISKNNVAENISEIFKIANLTKKCVVFFDECDSITWNRDSTQSDGGIVRRATESLFQQLDQMDSSNIFIGATNLVYRLDPAFERRFDLKMEFRRPDMDLKRSIEHFILPKFKLMDDVDNTIASIVEHRLKEKPNLSYYEIQVIVERAMKNAIISGTNIVRTSDIYELFKLSNRIQINI